MSGSSEPVVLDTGACIFLERPWKARLLWGILSSEQRKVILPTAVLAEWWTETIHFGNDILNAVEVEILTPELAKRAGIARSKCGGSPSAVDAIVMTSAAERGAVVYTVDHEDLQMFQPQFPNVRLLSPK